MDKNLTLEEAEIKLDEAVAKLENPQLSFKESVNCYTNACELLAFCMQEISDGKGKIEEINTKLKDMYNCDIDGD